MDEDVYLPDGSPVRILSLKKVPRQGWQATVRRPDEETLVVSLLDLRAREEMPPVPPEPEPPVEDPPPEGV